MIESLLDSADGFGGLMMLAHEWADRECIMRSYDLFARHVMCWPDAARAWRYTTEEFD